ncbi:class II fructose-bisphosphate aldolase [Brevibacterium sp. XM4083]|uniref:class II fructose-bisphosphate aldolase n=1 Tax=Brevibacterium sp. XM4083 TaxID=2583238 RepID=UPI001128F4D0|nr:class II fructose-bisphosphate aldolase [Brevibacterium sp. XM4083]MCM1011051.1 class II fructose-bisphosphate aldolase [Brevibacterium sp. XM4083]
MTKAATTDLLAALGRSASEATTPGQAGTTGTPASPVSAAALAPASAIGAFNVITLESAEAIAAGAESAGRPVIMQISENCVRYHGALAPIAGATLAIAAAASVPIAVHLDHATDLSLVDEALELGFDSVMYDGAHLPYAENCATTAEVVRRAHRRGIGVEAELGEIGGKDGAHAPGVRTDPAEAVDFAAATGVDALAVAVGSSHAMLERTSRLDLDLITRLAAAVPVPLVLHGSSGVPDAELERAIGAGMAKINVSTHLGSVFTGAVRETLAVDPRLVDPRKYLAPGREAFAAEVTRLLALFTEARAHRPLAKPAREA